MLLGLPQPRALEESRIAALCPALRALRALVRETGRNAARAHAGRGVREALRAGLGEAGLPRDAVAGTGIAGLRLEALERAPRDGLRERRLRHDGDVRVVVASAGAAALALALGGPLALALGGPLALALALGGAFAVTRAPAAAVVAAELGPTPVVLAAAELHRARAAHLLLAAALSLALRGALAFALALSLGGPLAFPLALALGGPLALALAAPSPSPSAPPSPSPSVPRPTVPPRRGAPHPAASEATPRTSTSSSKTLRVGRMRPPVPHAPSARLTDCRAPRGAQASRP